MIDHQQLAARIRRLPAFPATVTRLLEIMRNPKCTATDIERIIQHDAALTTNILKLANAARFGISRQVSSISHAATLMGQSRVRDLAVTAAYANLLPAKLPGYDISARRFFEHCAAVGVLSAELANTLGLPSVAEHAFLAGMLHDIGKLAISVFVEEARGPVMEAIHARELAFVAAEREVLGTDHAEVGGALADSWQLPATVVSVARLHHDPSRAPSHGVAPLVDVVHLADALAHSLGWGTDSGELARRTDPGACTRLGVKERHLEQVACAAMERIQTIVDGQEGKD